MRVLREKSDEKVIIGELAERYSVLEAYGRASRNKDPYLSPHGVFRGMAPGNRKHAVEFLETFGPLTMADSVIVRVELASFWAEQRRFRRVARLYENRDDGLALRSAIEEYLCEFPSADSAERDLLDDYRNLQGAVRTMQAEFRKSGARNINELIRAQDLERALNPAPGNRPESEHTEKAISWDPDFIRFRLNEGDDPRSMALRFVEEEIRYQTRGVRFSWWRGTSRQDDRFYRRFHVASLSSAIWDLFAMDTTGKPWRICPNDGNVFYPPRADRFYCTSREQTEASKEQYEEKRRRSRLRRRAKKKKGQRTC